MVRSGQGRANAITHTFILSINASMASSDSISPCSSAISISGYAGLRCHKRNAAIMVSNSVSDIFNVFAAMNTTSATETYIISGYQPSQCLGTLTLFVYSQAIAGSGGSVTVSYSVNAGVSFTNIYSVTTSRALTLDTVTLPQNQNPSLVQVKVVVTAGTSGSGNCEIYQAYQLAIT